MNPDNVFISADVDDETARLIEDGLDQFNEMHNGPDPTTPLRVVCRDDRGNVCGGLLGHTMWDWLAIAVLWVEESSRGRGIGRRLLLYAEEAARMRGCRRSQLATMTFQAPEFYRRFGYTEIGRVPDYPPGHSYIWMTKVLAGASVSRGARDR